MCNWPNEFENQIWEHLVAWLICFAYQPSVVVSRSPGRGALFTSADLGQLETASIGSKEWGLPQNKGPWSSVTTKWLGKQVLYDQPCPLGFQTSLHSLLLLKTPVNSCKLLFGIFPCLWQQRRVRSPGDKQAVISLQLNCRVSSMNVVCWGRELKEFIFHSKVGFIKYLTPRCYAGCRVSLGLLSDPRRGNTTHLGLFWFPQSTQFTCLIHSLMKT